MKIHILGIAGSMSTPLTLALVTQGHIVSGSDQDKIYPPFSSILKANNIPINKTEIDNNIDLIITNGAFNKFTNTKNEYEKSVCLKIPHISATKYIAKYLIKKDSILVAGSVGKTTTTAILSWVFLKLGLNPSYFIAGQLVDNIPSCQISNSNYSIVEAGEDFHGLETQAKFLYYPIKYLILTSTFWEHKDCYPNATKNLLAYKKLVKKIPKDGLLIYNPQDKGIQKILPFCKSKKIPYVNKQFETSLLGLHNQQNISAAYTLCKEFKFDETKVLSAIKSFSGVKLRLQQVANKNNILYYTDFAQSSNRIKATITALKTKYPARPIKVLLNPHAGFLQFKDSVAQLSDSLDDVDQIFLSKISFLKNNNKQTRISFIDYKSIFGDKIKYLPITSDLITTVCKSLKPGDIFINFSSGGLDSTQALAEILKSFK